MALNPIDKWQFIKRLRTEKEWKKISWAICSNMKDTSRIIFSPFFSDFFPLFSVFLSIVILMERASDFLILIVLRKVGHIRWIRMPCPEETKPNIAKNQAHLSNKQNWFCWSFTIRLKLFLFILDFFGFSVGNVDKQSG